jgi:hypothetical protein
VPGHTGHVKIEAERCVLCSLPQRVTRREVRTRSIVRLVLAEGDCLGESVVRVWAVSVMKRDVTNIPCMKNEAVDMFSFYVSGIQRGSWDGLAELLQSLATEPPTPNHHLATTQHNNTITQRIHQRHQPQSHPSVATYKSNATYQTRGCAIYLHLCASSQGLPPSFVGYTGQ